MNYLRNRSQENMTKLRRSKEVLSRLLQKRRGKTNGDIIVCKYKSNDSCVSVFNHFYLDGAHIARSTITMTRIYCFSAVILSEIEERAIN